jgi:Carboxypeptidase regulatory-like domain
MTAHRHVRVGRFLAATGRAVALALALCACRTEAQNNATVRLTVDVQDQTGAHISGASLTATDTTTGASLRATADATGQAIVHLNPGTYDVTARANGFDAWEQKAMRLDADQEWDFTLRVSSYEGPIIIEETWGPEPEHQAVSAEIQAEPLEQITLPAKRLHHKRHLF